MCSCEAGDAASVHAGTGEPLEHAPVERDSCRCRLLGSDKKNQPPPMSDEDAYKDFMRRKLVYQEWENSVLREAMKRIAQQGGA